MPPPQTTQRRVERSYASRFGRPAIRAIMVGTITAPVTPSRAIKLQVASGAKCDCTTNLAPTCGVAWNCMSPPPVWKGMQVSITSRSVIPRRSIYTRPLARRGQQEYSMHFGKPVVPLDVTIPVMSYGRTRRAENFPVAGPRARSAMEGTPEETLSMEKRCRRRSLGFNSSYKESKS